MTILLDSEPVAPGLDEHATLADALIWVQTRLATTGKVIVKVELDGTCLNGPALTESQSAPIAQRQVGISTADQKELSRSMIGRLAALIEFIGPQHRQVATLIEQNQTSKALGQLGQVLSAWQQIQHSFASLMTMLDLRVEDLQVGELPAKELIADFSRQLGEMQTALQNKDMVLLTDILQYEMDSAIANWTNLLALLLGIVDGVVPAP